MPTSIQVSEDTWRKLNLMKEPGDTFDDVIDRLFRRTEVNFPPWFKEYMSYLPIMAKGMSK